MGPTSPPQGHGYPPPAPSGPIPPVRRARAGLSLGAFLGLLLGAWVVVLGAGLVVVTVLFIRQRDRAQEAARAAAERSSDDEAQEAPSIESHTDLPTVTRHVPNHSLRLLEGCSEANVATIASVLGDAIDDGAPKYNDGKFVDCYRTYVGAALELERSLPKSCGGPSRALASGRQTARGLPHASEQAWAMRDAFDGLLDVVARSRQGGGASL